MTSKAVKNAQAEGYQWTGNTSRGSWDKEKVLKAADELKVMGNKVKILLDRQETQFRDRKDVHTFWVVMVKYSDEYKAHQQAERERMEAERRLSQLRKMADECTLEELQWMVNFKVAAMMQEKIDAINELTTKVEADNANN